jgi:hypothetical protein
MDSYEIFKKLNVNGFRALQNNFLILKKRSYLVKNIK